MSQPFLFYSDRCSNSIQIIETLKGLNKTGLYKFVKVETLPRNQIPEFLKKVPTMYVPDTRDVIVGKENILGFIAKPTNSRNEKPVAGNQETASKDYSPYEGPSGLGESYSLWDAPTKFPSQGGSMYTFLDQTIPTISTPPQPTSQNTLNDQKTSTNNDIAQRMEAMQKQREKEFGAVTRK